MQIYVHKNNQQLGPFTEDEIKAQLASGAITPQDHVWWQGQANWLPLGQTSLVTPDFSPLPDRPGAPMPTGAAYGAATSTSQLAIWSLVCGCLSIICGLFGAVPAIVLGHMALCDINKTPGRSGRGLARAGLIIGYIMTALTIIALCFYAAMLPTILKAIEKQQQSGQTFYPTPSTNNADDSSTNSATASPPAMPDPSTNSDSSTNTPTAAPMQQ